MATRISDARDRQRAVSRTAEPAPYAGRGAGLYSEVSWPQTSGPDPRSDRPASDDKGGGPRP